FGVSRIVRFGAAVATVPEDFVQELERRLMRGLVVEQETKFHAGDEVKITDGPLRDLYGVFVRNVTDRERVLIMLNTVGKLTVEVGKHDLMLICPPARTRPETKTSPPGSGCLARKPLKNSSSKPTKTRYAYAK